MVVNKPAPPVMKKPSSGTNLEELEMISATIPGQADHCTPPGSVRRGKPSPLFAKWAEATEVKEKIVPKKPPPGKISISPQLAGLLGNVGKQQEAEVIHNIKKESKNVSFSNAVDKVRQNSQEENEKHAPHLAKMVDELRQSIDKNGNDEDARDETEKRAQQESAQVKRGAFASMVDNVRSMSMDQDDGDADDTKATDLSKPKLAGAASKVIAESPIHKMPRLADMVEKAKSIDEPQQQQQQQNPEENEDATVDGKKPPERKKTLQDMMTKMRSMSSQDESTIEETRLGSRNDFGSMIDKVHSLSMDNEDEEEEASTNITTEAEIAINRDEGSAENTEKKSGFAGMVAKVQPPEGKTKPRLADMVNEVRTSVDKEGLSPDKQPDVIEEIDDKTKDGKKKKKASGVLPGLFAKIHRRKSKDELDPDHEKKSPPKLAAMVDVVKSSIDQGDEDVKKNYDTKKETELDTNEVEAENKEQKTKETKFSGMFSKIRKKSIDEYEKTNKPKLAGMVDEVRQSMEKGKDEEDEPPAADETEIDEVSEKKDSKSKISGMFDKIRRKSLENLDKKPKPKLAEMVDEVRLSMEQEKDAVEEPEPDVPAEPEPEEVEKNEEKEQETKKSKSKISGMFDKIRKKSIDDMDKKRKPKLAEMVDEVRLSMEQEKETEQEQEVPEHSEVEKDVENTEKDPEEKKSKSRISGMFDKIRRKSLENLDKQPTPKLAEMVDEVRLSIEQENPPVLENEETSKDESEETKNKDSKSKLSGMLAKIRRKSKDGLDDNATTAKPKLAEMVDEIRLSMDQGKGEEEVDENTKDETKADGKTMLKCTTLPLGASVMKSEDVDIGDGLKEKRQTSQPDLLSLDQKNDPGDDETKRSSTLPRVLDREEKKKAPATHHTLPRAKSIKDMPPLIQPKVDELLKTLEEDDDDDLRRPAPNACCRRLPCSEELFFGSIQIVVAVLIVLLGVSAIITESKYGLVSYRIWGGVIFIVAGGLCIGMRLHYKSTNFVLTVLGFGILSLVVAGVGITIDYFAFKVDNEKPDNATKCEGFRIVDGVREPKCFSAPLWDQRIWHVVCHISSMVLFALQALISFVETVFCCRRVCCFKATNDDDEEKLDYCMNVSADEKEALPPQPAPITEQTIIEEKNEINGIDK